VADTKKKKLIFNQNQHKMKKLIDNQNVSSRVFNYLLDFNEKDEWRTIEKMFNESSLKRLNKQQFLELFEAATKIDRILVINPNIEL
jgi:hypothetical protein